MLNSIRKFSSSPYAIVLLGIVILPFVMWCMGDVFRGGNINTIVDIDNKKISTQEFINHINRLNFQGENLSEEIFQQELTNFIAKNLINIESKRLDILLSDSALLKIIKNDKAYKKNNTFSRTAYEKFLISNNLSAIQYEQYLRESETRKQLFDFISGGIKSPKFLVNNEYDSNNQIKNLLIINLDDIYKKELNFSNEQIKQYYEKNIEQFNEIFRLVKYSIITPMNITAGKEYNNSFFKKLDEIEDLIASGKNIDHISKKFNLSIETSKSFNEKKKDRSGEIVSFFDEDLVKKIFKIKSEYPTELLNLKDDYFLIQLEKSEIIPRKITSVKVKDKISSILKKEKILNKNSEVIEKIIRNKFKKNDFDNLALNNNIKIKKIKLNSIFDNKNINKKFINPIYNLPEKKMYVFSDSELNENLLIYVDKIEHVSIDQNLKEYDKYFLQTNAQIINNIYNIYDSYMNKKYDVDINYNAADKVKNYFK